MPISSGEIICFATQYLAGFLLVFFNVMPGGNMRVFHAVIRSSSLFLFAVQFISSSPLPLLTTVSDIRSTERFHPSHRSVDDGRDEIIIDLKIIF